MESLRKRIEALQHRIDEFSLRERIILFLTVSLLLYLLINATLLSPLEAQQTQLLERTRALHAEIATLDQQAIAVVEASRHDPDAEQRRQLASLEQRTTQLRQQVHEALVGQVDPRQMSQALQQVVAHQQGLRLLKIENLPPETIQDLPADSTETIFRHRVSIELEGDYRSVVAYLEALEALEWQFVWDAMSVETHTYPLNRVRLQLHTLSLQRGWLGV